MWGKLAFTGMLTVGAILYPASAHADPVSDYTKVAASAVCSTLDKYPSVAGVAGVVEGVVTDSGFTYGQARTVVAVAVMDYCPRNIPLLNAFVATYAPRKVV